MSKRKIRADFRKNRTPRQRSSDLTRRFDREDTKINSMSHARNGLAARENSPGGDRGRRRNPTMNLASFAVQPSIDLANAGQGRVLSVHGLLSIVDAADGSHFHCTTRRLLKTLSTEQRHVVAAGDRVFFRPADPQRQNCAEAADRPRRKESLNGSNRERRCSAGQCAENNT